MACSTCHIYLDSYFATKGKGGCDFLLRCLSCDLNKHCGCQLGDNIHCQIGKECKIHSVHELFNPVIVA